MNKVYLTLLLALLLYSCGVSIEYERLKFRYCGNDNVVSEFGRKSYWRSIHSQYTIKIPKGYDSIHRIKVFEDHYPVKIKVYYPSGAILYISDVSYSETPENYDNIKLFLSDSSNFQNDYRILQIYRELGIIVKQYNNNPPFMWYIGKFFDLYGIDEQAFHWREVFINNAILIGYKNVTEEERVKFDMSIDSISEKSNTKCSILK